MLATEDPNPQNEMVNRLDSAVSDVFEMMLERSCDPLDGDDPIVDGRIMARIQFTGAINGECILYASQATAEVTAEALLGAISQPCDPMVDDAIGELCNMIAGGWKNKLEHPQASCLISVPAVTREGLIGLEGKFGTKFNRTYSFQGNVFGILLAF
ncbi:MAG: chemotaxis protein CheX [Edaphobacter sp.]